MELSGDDANRWEQTSNKLRELEERVASYRETAKVINNALSELLVSLEKTQESISELSKLTYKESLRQVSGMLNADEKYTSVNPAEPQPQHEAQKKSANKPKTKCEKPTPVPNKAQPISPRQTNLLDVEGK